LWRYWVRNGPASIRAEEFTKACAANFPKLVQIILKSMRFLSIWNFEVGNSIYFFAADATAQATRLYSYRACDKRLLPRYRMGKYIHSTREPPTAGCCVWCYGARGYMTEHADAHNEVTLISFCKDHLKAVTVPFEGKLPYMAVPVL